MLPQIYEILLLQVKMSTLVATSSNQVAKAVLIWSSRQKYSPEFHAVLTMKEMVKSQTNETTQSDVSDPPPVSPGPNPGPHFPLPPIPSPPAPDIPMPRPGMPPPPIQPPPDNLPPLPGPDIEPPELPEIVPPPSITPEVTLSTGLPGNFFFF